jgi:hypothetical protein
MIEIKRMEKRKDTLKMCVTVDFKANIARGKEGYLMIKGSAQQEAKNSK